MIDRYMYQAIEEARIGINNNEGGPFGAIVVNNGVIVGKGHNEVILKKDPTCHGEIMAIKDACKTLNTYNLEGCILYTTGEPCDMCLCACMWANIDKIYYGATILDNSSIGFRDHKFDKIFEGREKLKDYLINTDRKACLELFEEYKKLNHEIY